MTICVAKTELWDRAGRRWPNRRIGVNWRCCEMCELVVFIDAMDTYGFKRI